MLEKIAAERLMTVTAQLVKRGDEEARSLSDLLEQQRSRIAKAAKEFDPNQLTLDLVPEERREREGDRRHWEGRLTRLERDCERSLSVSVTPMRCARIALTRRICLPLAGIGVNTMAAEIYRDPISSGSTMYRPLALWLCRLS